MLIPPRNNSICTRPQKAFHRRLSLTVWSVISKKNLPRLKLDHATFKTIHVKQSKEKKMNDFQSQDYSQDCPRSVNIATLSILTSDLGGENCPLTLTSSQALQSL